MKKNWLILLFEICVLSICFCQENNCLAKVYFLSELDESAIVFLKTDSSIYAKADNIKITIGYQIDKLYNMLHYYKMCINTINDNIYNMNTTRTVDGGLYRKQIVYLDTTGKISVVKVENNNPCFIYDPTHPDSIKTGPKSGYVEYPNIDLDMELSELHKNIVQYNSFVDLIVLLDKAVIIEKENYCDYLTTLIFKRNSR